MQRTVVVIAGAEDPATIVLRDAQHLAAVEVKRDAMVLTLMRYAEELVDTSEYSFPSAKDVRKPELEMARTLVKNLEDTWDPEQYTDRYRANLRSLRGINRPQARDRLPRALDSGEVGLRLLDLAEAVAVPGTLAKVEGIGRDRFEFQMLYGVRPALQRRLVAQSYKRPRSAASRNAGTFHTASSTIACDIFEPPSSRSTNVIGISTTRKPLRSARYVVSIWKA